MLTLLLWLSTAPASAAPVKTADCRAIERLYPQLDRSYNHKAPLLAQAGWGRLEDWGSTELDNFRQSVLDCRNKGFLKSLDPVFLAGDLDKKMEELRKESSRIKDDARILAAIETYQRRVDVVARHWDETSAAELRDIKVLLPRISGIDDSRYFNKAGDLQNRIDTLLTSPPKPSLVRRDLPGPASDAAQKSDPRGYKKCAALQAEYSQLVKSSASLRQQLIAEQEVEPMEALRKQQESVLRKLENISVQMEQGNCGKFF